MRNLHIQLAYLSIIVALASITSCTHKERVNPLSIRIDTIFGEFNNSGSPGCALAVIKDGKIIYSHGYGMADLEHNIPIKPNSVFYIASVSKQFVAMCMLLLEEEGKISLDDNIRKYLPELPVYIAPVTIRQLIQHTSGIRDIHTFWAIDGRDDLNKVTEDEAYKLICSWKDLDFVPGEKQQYSNSGYFLCSLIVRKASGKSLREFAEEKIFKPLGMKNSQFQDDNRNLIKDRAFGYAPLMYGGFGNAFMRYDLVGSGGLYTTVEDLYLWDQNFYHNKLGKGTMELINKMLTPGKLNNGSQLDYCCGLTRSTYRGENSFQHPGSYGGYKSFMIRFPDKKLTVILLSNLADFRERDLALRVADIFLN